MPFAVSLRILSCLLAPACLLPAPAAAWNAGGHRLTASIAWEHLTPEARVEASRLLRLHPDHERWLAKGGEGSPQRTAFIEASTWPDDIRDDARFHDAGRDEPTPVLPGFADMERHGDWHFVNRPFDGPLDRPPLSGQLEVRIPSLAATLADGTRADGVRAYALPWLMHLVGDAHQPLHTVDRMLGDGQWDAGGNRVRLRNPFKRRHPETTLHALWDDLPAPPWLRGERLDQASRALTAIHPRPAPSLSSRRWIEESWQIARAAAYPPLPAEGRDVIGVDEEFLGNSREIADRRVVDAGYRLADLLNRLFRAAK